MLHRCARLARHEASDLAAEEGRERPRGDVTSGHVALQISQNRSAAVEHNTVLDNAGSTEAGDVQRLRMGVQKQRQRDRKVVAIEEDVLAVRNRKPPSQRTG